MRREIPLSHVKGQTVDIAGTITRFGRARDLVANGDELRFAICDEDTRDALIEVTSGAGITVNESGEYRGLIAPASIPAPGDYWWELWLTEGGSGQAYLVSSGPFTIEDSSE